MKRKLMIYMTFILMVLCVSSGYADEATYLDTSLTLDQVYDMALENSITYQNQVDALESAQKNYDDAIFDRTEKIDYSATNPDEYLNKFLLNYYVEEKGVYLEWAKQDVINTEVDVKINAEKEYLKMTQLANDIDLKKAEYDIAIKNQQNAKVRYDLGQITETEYETFGTTVMMKSLDLDKSNQTYVLAEMDFNMMIGYPLDTSLTLTSLIDTNTEIDYNLNYLIKNFDQNSKAVTRAKQQHELDLQKMEIVDDNYVRNSSSVNMSYAGKPSYYTDLSNAIDDYDENLEKIINDGNIDLTVEYNELINLETTVQINQLNVEKADNNLKANELKLSMGMVSENDVEISKEALYNANVILITDENNLYIKNLYFEHQNNYLTNTTGVDVDELVEKYGSETNE